MSKGLKCLSIAKLKQLKRRKSIGSLNTGVQTKKNGNSLKRFNNSYGDEDDEEPFVSTPTRSTQRGKNLAGVGLPAIAAPPTVTAPYNKNKVVLEVKCPLSLQAGTVKLGVRG